MTVAELITHLQQVEDLTRTVVMLDGYGQAIPLTEQNFRVDYPAERERELVESPFDRVTNAPRKRCLIVNLPFMGE